MSSEVWVRPDPRVAVEHPRVRWCDDDPLVTMTELLHVTCSECGDVTDYDDNRPSAKERLIGIARAHANEAHEGLVDAVGWVR